MISDDKPRKKLLLIKDDGDKEDLDRVIKDLESQGYDVSIMDEVKGDDEFDIVIHDEYSHFDPHTIDSIMGRMHTSHVQPMQLPATVQSDIILHGGRGPDKRRIPRNIGIIGMGLGNSFDKPDYNVVANKSQGYFPTEEQIDYKMKKHPTRSMTSIAHTALMMAALGDMAGTFDIPRTRTTPTRHTSKPKPSAKVLAKRKAVKKARKEQRR